MNKKVKISGFILIIFLFCLLILKSWGEPVSELEKSNIELSAIKVLMADLNEKFRKQMTEKQILED